MRFVKLCKRKKDIRLTDFIEYINIYVNIRHFILFIHVRFTLWNKTNNAVPELQHSTACVLRRGIHKLSFIRALKGPDRQQYVYMSHHFEAHLIKQYRITDL